MEISDNTPKIQPIDTTSGVRGKVRAIDKTDPAGSGPDRVELSDRARELQSARAAVKAMDAVDHDKVARIRAQIKSGTYDVDAGKIAEKMLEETFLGKPTD